MKNSFRSRKIIDKEFQYSFILKQVLFLVLSLTLLIAALVIWNRHSLKENHITQMPTDAEVARIAAEKKIDPASAEYAWLYLTRSRVLTASDLLLRPFIIICIINCLLLVVFNVFISHRIVGPIFSIKRTLKRRLSGESGLKISLRKRDHFQELADLINKNIEK